MLANELQNVWLYAQYIHETAVRNIEKVAVCPRYVVVNLVLPVANQSQIRLRP